MKDVHATHAEMMKTDPAYREEYEALAPEFEMARAFIEARSEAGLTQEEVARRMGTKQALVSRLESGRLHPTTRTLERFARATGTRLRIRFERTEAR